MSEGVIFLSTQLILFIYLSYAIVRVKSRVSKLESNLNQPKPSSRGKGPFKVDAKKKGKITLNLESEIAKKEKGYLN